LRHESLLEEFGGTDIKPMPKMKVSRIVIVHGLSSVRLPVCPSANFYIISYFEEIRVSFEEKIKLGFFFEMLVIAKIA
jgi:hypothetical protein